MKITAKIFYEWQGASHINPLLTKKNDSQIKDALAAIPSQLSQLLPSATSIEALSNLDKDKITFEIIIGNNKEQENVINTLRNILQEWDMRAEIKEEK
jgi:hypothetical protein